MFQTTNQINIENGGFMGCLWWFNGISWDFPGLVNVHIAMENHHFNGTTHYFYSHFQ